MLIINPVNQSKIKNTKKSLLSLSILAEHFLQKVPHLSLQGVIFVFSISFPLGISL